MFTASAYGRSRPGRGDHFLTVREREVGEDIELLYVIVNEQMPYARLCIADLFMIALIEPLFSVPFQRDHNFIDRKDIFSQIKEQLQMHHRVSLCGIGGIGYRSFP